MDDSVIKLHLKLFAQYVCAKKGVYVSADVLEKCHREFMAIQDSTYSQTRKTYSGLIRNLGLNEIFVFGSNPEGRHGMGNAKFARDNFGAINGQARGLQGRSYGLITKNLRKGVVENGIVYNKTGRRSISREQIIENIRELYDTANKKEHLTFYVAYTGKRGGPPLLSGYALEELAEMFAVAGPIPTGIVFEERFSRMVYEK